MVCAARHSTILWRSSIDSSAMTGVRRNPRRACASRCARPSTTTPDHSDSAHDSEADADANSASAGAAADADADVDADSDSDSGSDSDSDSDFANAERDADTHRSCADAADADEIEPRSPPSSARNARKAKKPRGIKSRGAAPASRGASSAARRGERTAGRAVAADGGGSADADDVMDALFAELDVRGARRITAADVRRVADDYGMDVTPEEAFDMVRFWDSTGSASLSRDDLADVAAQCKVVK